MPIIAKGSSKVFTPAPAGVHHALCVDVVDLGMVTTPWGEKPQVEFRFQLDKFNAESEVQRRHMVVRRFTNSLHEKANLRSFLESWFGREFTESETEEGVDVEDLCLSLPALLQVIHQQSAKGKTFANIKTIMPFPEGAALFAPTSYVRVKDRTPEAPPEDEVPF